MKVENVKRVTLSDYEVDTISETLYMIKKIAEEFNYDREDVFNTLLSCYDMNDGVIDNEIGFF